MLSALLATFAFGGAFGEDSLKAPRFQSDDPCTDPEFQNEDVCKAKAQNADCSGPGCWSCDGPLTSTDCVLSNWISWKSQEDLFQKQCAGELVRWGSDSGVQDCGVACFGCSYIRACCDTCNTILKVTGQWHRISCTDVETNVKYSYGVSTTKSTSWSRTETWSQSVSAKAEFNTIVEGVTGDINLSAQSSHSLTETTSGSWSVSTTENTDITFTQPAETCSWHWRTTVTDSCGEKSADSKDFILTRGSSRGNSPCCLPGLEMDPDTKQCPPDNAGNVVNLCSDNRHARARLTELMKA